MEQVNVQEDNKYYPRAFAVNSFSKYKRYTNDTFSSRVNVAESSAWKAVRKI